MTPLPPVESEHETETLGPPNPPIGASSFSAPLSVHLKDRPFPGFGQAFLLFPAMTFLQVLLTIPFVLFGLYRNPLALALPTLLGSAAALGYGYSKNFVRTGDKFRQVFPFIPLPAHLFFIVLITAVGLLTVNLQITKLVVRIIPPPSIFARVLADMIRPDLPWTAFLAVALVSPIAEEFLFRGLVLHAFIARYGTRKAIILSAILFGLMHWNPWQFFTALLFGLFSAWCFIRTRSLFPCFFAHIANNSIVFFLPRVRPRVPAIAAWMTHHLVWVNATGIFLLIAGGYLIYKFSNANHLGQFPENTKENKC